MSFPCDPEKLKHNSELLPLTHPRSRAHAQDGVVAKDTPGWPLRLAVILLIYSLFRLLHAFSGGSAHIPSADGLFPATIDFNVSPNGIDVPTRIQRLWGQYSPYFPAGEYILPPKGCNLTQVSSGCVCWPDVPS